MSGLNQQFTKLSARQGPASSNLALSAFARRSGELRRTTSAESSARRRASPAIAGFGGQSPHEVCDGGVRSPKRQFTASQSPLGARREGELR